MPPATPDDARAARKSGRRTIARVAPYLWPRDDRGLRLRVMLALVMLLVSKLIAVYTPFLYKGAVDALAKEGVPELALGAVGLTVAYGVARAMNVGLQQLRDVFFAPVAQRALRRIALVTFRHIHQLSLRYHLTRRTGAMSRVIERGVKGVEFLLRFLLLSIGPLVLELLLVAVILAVVFDIRYLAIVAVTIGLYVAFTFAVTEWRVKLRRVMNDQDTDANQKAIDSLLNYETVKYFGAEAREEQRYDHAMAGYEKAAKLTAYSLAFLNFGQSVLITIGLVGVMVLAALGVQSGQLTVGDFVMVNAYMIQITVPLNFLGTVYREIRQALIDMDEMFDLLEQPAEIGDRPGAPELKVTGGAISLDKVHFGYEPEREILKGISIEVGAGQSVAIVGATGSGKSTILKLLTRLYDVDAGRITVDGVDVRDLALAELRDAVGIVPQDVFLFAGDILENIRLGHPEISDADAEAAARALHLERITDRLPGGLREPVRERGSNLSSGERQLIAFARVLAIAPPVLALDEATSSVDSQMEHLLQEAVGRVMQDRTSLIIAHRLSTIRDVDRILVLHQGRVVEEGTHDELMAEGGYYWRLHQLQYAGSA